MEQGKRTKEELGDRIESGVANRKIGGPLELTKNPTYIQHRLAIFEELWAKEQERIKALEKPDITITLPDGSVKHGKAFETTPFNVAKEISQSLVKECIAARIVYSKRFGSGAANYVNPDAEEDHKSSLSDVYDMSHKLEGDCTLELIKFDSPVGKEVFWHSSAHVLGQALENTYGVHLTNGPPLDLGFFYDFYMGESGVSTESFKDIEKSVKDSIKKNTPFRRLVLSKPQALELFKFNPFKLQFIQNKIPDDAQTSVYACGSLIDLCPGPHVPSTGTIKALKLTKCSATNWLGDIRNDTLQRIYGVAFPSKEQLDEHIRIQEEIAKRDHRIVAEAQKLFSITKYSQGSPSLLPHGTRIMNTLTELIRKEYWARGFQEVNTPCMNLNSMWKTSGHYFKYKAGMFFVKADEGYMGIKPMNCPGHCAIFNLHLHSYRDLPIRMADFGVLHRNELSGALSGMTRVRKFQQDDAHIFCTEDQISQEIIGALDFVKYIYSIFGFEYALELSTRPPERVGSDAIWDKAEAALQNALDTTGLSYTIGVGEGAFYGPKIDIKVKDCFNRSHQLGTIQLDFQLPERFNLQYRAKDNEETPDHLTDEALESHIKAIKDADLANMKIRADKTQTNPDDLIGVDENTDPYDYEVSGKLKNGFRRPVMIHRAVLGSLERCFAILTEVYGGKWPFWLSPRQAVVIPISSKFRSYAEMVKNRLHLEGYYVDADQSTDSLNKKVRNAQQARYNYILVVGASEVENGTITVRIRDQEKPVGVMKVQEVCDLFKSLSPEESDAWKNLKAQSFYEGMKIEFDTEIAEAENTEEKN